MRMVADRGTNLLLIITSSALLMSFQGY